MKKIPALLFCAGLLAGCGTMNSYDAQAPAGHRTALNYPIPVYSPEMSPSRPCVVLGDLSISPTPITVLGGGIASEMKRVMEQAHARGADAVQIVAIQKPGFMSPDYSVQAKLLRYADVWETVALSENDLKAYLRKNQSALDPIEGIWSDGLPHRLGIIRDASKPGRGYVAYTLTPDVASWQVGYKKMDILPGDPPGSYHMKYYADDFSRSVVIVTLEQNRRFRFILNSGDDAISIVFTKLKL
jgi:hypothetical protein